MHLNLRHHRRSALRIIARCRWLPTASRVLGLAVAWTVGDIGCGSGGTGTGGSGGTCEPANDGCIPAGCQAGEAEAEGGACVPAGVPADMCAPGFDPEDGGCTAVLPADPCPDGLMAVPGESRCHEVVPCADGTWGDIPVEAGTQFVDRSYSGASGPSDGTETRPWTKIQDGVDAAQAGATVAVAAGTYAEDVLIADRPVRLTGRCPKLVAIAGTAAEPAAIQIGPAAGGTEIRTLTISGQASGVFVSGAEDIGVDRVWVHDTADIGLRIQSGTGAATVALSESLIEATSLAGVLVSGSDLSVSSSVVRETQPDPATSGFGLGIAVQDDPVTANRAVAKIERSVLQSNHESGLLVMGSDVTLEGTAVLDTEPRMADGSAGRGIEAQDSPTSGEPAALVVLASVIERSHEAGIAIFGASAELAAVTVRDTLPRASDMAGGAGIAAQTDMVTAARPALKVASSLVETSRRAGILIVDGDLTLQSVIVRNTEPQASDGLYGDGVAAISLEGPSQVEMQACLIARNPRAGISTFGATIAIGSTAMECNGVDIVAEDDGMAKSSINDLGSNSCGCEGQVVNCQVASLSLVPPESGP